MKANKKWQRASIITSSGAAFNLIMLTDSRPEQRLCVSSRAHRRGSGDASAVEDAEGGGERPAGWRKPSSDNQQHLGCRVNVKIYKGGRMEARKEHFYKNPSLGRRSERVRKGRLQNKQKYKIYIF